MPERDIAIVGCGPAGLAAALFLRRDGNRVTIFDQFDTPRPLGSGLMLQPTGLAVLADLGLEPRIRARGREIRRMLGKAAPSGRTVLDVAYDVAGRGRNGVAIHRSALFAALHDVVLEMAIPIETSRPIASVDSGAGGRAEVIDAAGRKAGPFDLVVDAGGLRSPLSAQRRERAGLRNLPFGALWATLPWVEGRFEPDQLEQRYRRSDRMVGVLPLGRPSPTGPEQAAFFWSLPAEGHEAWRSAGLNRWKDEVLAIWPETETLLRGIDDPDQLVMARYCHFTLRTPHGAAVAHIGDSAHATSPQLGQGANMALLDAAALAAALRQRSDLGDALALYARLRRLHVRLYQALSVAFTPFYQSADPVRPFLRDRLLWPLSRIWPTPHVLSALVRGQLVDPLPNLGLRAPERRDAVDQSAAATAAKP